MQTNKQTQIWDAIVLLSAHCWLMKNIGEQLKLYHHRIGNLGKGKASPDEKMKIKARPSFKKFDGENMRIYLSSSPWFRHPFDIALSSLQPMRRYMRIWEYDDDNLQRCLSSVMRSMRILSTALIKLDREEWCASTPFTI